MSVEKVFEEMSGAIAELGPSLVQKVKGVIQFTIKGDKGNFVIDLKNGSGKLFNLAQDKKENVPKVDLTITVSEPDFIALVNNKLNPQTAFMRGKIKVKGNMGLAMKLNTVMDATRKYMAKNKKSAGAPAASSAGGSALKSAETFRLIGLAMKERGPEFVKKVNGIIQFNITKPNGAWNLDLKNGSGSLTEGTKKADLTITVSDEDFFAMSLGKLNAQQAFMKGKLKVKGNMGLAMKLNVVMEAARPKSKL